jgi:oligopeptidase B
LLPIPLHIFRTQTANETYLLGPSYKETGMQLVRAFEQGVQYHIDVGTRNDVVLLVSRDEKDESITDSSYLNLEYSLGETTVDFLPIEDDWGRNLVVLKTGYVMTDMDLFQDFVVVYERSTLDARQRIRLTERLSSREEWIVPIPEADAYVAVLSPAGNMHYESDSVRFFLESPAEPRKTYEYHVPSRRLSLLSKDRSGEADIVQERTVVSSQDGTLVPLTLVYRKETQNSKATEALPAVLIGYGAYGQSVNLAFDPATRPLLDRGFLLAYAHTRGGGELGKSWHRRGRLYEKGRAVDDYLACAEALTNYTLVDKPVRLAARAFSAGGVIAGAAVNRRPDLFSAAALTNPFLDVEATLKNESLHLTRHEWDEYGNPLDDALAANTIASYCPVANANGGQHLPKFLLIGTMDDKEVPVWNPVVFGKKAREQARGRPDTDVLLYIVGQGGHRLVGARSHVAALEVAFILRSMNTASYS